MASGWRYGLLTTGAILALLLVIADFIVAQVNRSAQIEVNQRQQFINQGIELSGVNQALVRAIAVAAAKNQDSKLGEVLAEQGITVKESTAAPPPAAAPDPAAVGTAGKGHK